MTTAHTLMPSLAAGIHSISAAVYHADPCPEPSLSASIATCLCLSSPAHARHAHPRLNPAVESEEAERFDIGTAAHALLLEGDAGVAVLDYPDWRTNAAKAARDQARTQGKTPLLRKIWTDVEAMVISARAQLARHRDGNRAMFTDGQSEQTLIWQEPDSGIWCRARLDWLRPDNIDDYKTTNGSANPDDWTRTALFANGCDVQCAFYLRGLKVLTGFDATFRFAVQETYPPYALSVITLAPSAMTLAEKKVLYAIEHWQRGLASGEWTGYTRRLCHAEVPAWHESWWLQKELR
jgi:PDDEXK-like domain of unknown function (DUF3799)